MDVTVYTDGACSGNPGPGGWGWAVDRGPYGSGSERRSTNQRMEVWAVLDALGTLLPIADALTVVSDSTYVVNCFRDRWWAGWEKRGWKNSQKQPVANQDLWKPLVGLYRANSARISFRWVKGHSGDRMNDRVMCSRCRRRSRRARVGWSVWNRRPTRRHRSRSTGTPQRRATASSADAAARALRR